MASNEQFGDQEKPKPRKALTARKMARRPKIDWAKKLKGQGFYKKLLGDRWELGTEAALKLRNENAALIEKVLFSLNRLSKLKKNDRDIAEKALFKLAEAGIKPHKGLFFENSGITFKKAKSDKFLNAVIELYEFGIKMDRDTMGALSWEKGESPKFIEALKKLHERGVDVNTGVIGRLSIEKASSAEFIDGFLNLRKDVPFEFGDSYILKVLPINKAVVPEYIETLKDLHFSFVKINATLIDALSIEKALLPEYVQVLKKLAIHDVEVHPGVVRGLSIEKALTPEYIDALIDLRTAGIKYFEGIVARLAIENALDADCINALIELHIAGIEVGGMGSLSTEVTHLTLEKAKNRKYIDALLKLHEGGIKISDNLIEVLSMEKAQSNKYLETLLKMKKEGAKVDPNTVRALPFLADDKFAIEYFTALGKLAELKIALPPDLLREEIEKHGSANKYVEALAALKKLGVSMDYYFFNKQKDLRAKFMDPEYMVNFTRLIKSLPPEKAKAGHYAVNQATSLVYRLGLGKGRNTDYVDSIINLRKTGFLKKVNEIVETLPLEKGASKEYVDTLVRIAKATPMDFREMYDLALSLSMKKAANEKYVDALIRLIEGGFKDSIGRIVDNLTSEKALDDSYLDTLLGMGFSDGAPDGPKSKSPYLISAFTLKKAKDPDYVFALKELIAGGAQINDRTLDRLEIKDAKDKEYIAILKGLPALGIKVNNSLLIFLTPEKAKIPEYIELLKFLHRANFNVNLSLLESIPRNKIADKEFWGTLKRLRSCGINIGGSFVYALRGPKIGNAAYIDALQRFGTSGVGINYRNVLELTIPKATSKVFVDNMIDLHQTGIEVRNLFANTSIAQMADKAYVDALKHLHKNGFKFSHTDLLTSEKVKDKDYAKLLLIHRNARSADYAYLKKVIGASGTNKIFNNEYSLPKKEANDALTYIYELKQTHSESVLLNQILDSRAGRFALPIVREINDLHNASIERRQAVIKNFDLGPLYMLVVAGREEVFTSSFRKVLFPVIMEKMKDHGMDAVDFINSVDPDKTDFRYLIRVFSKFNKLKPFLDTVKDQKKKSVFLKEFVFGLDPERGGVEDAISILETFDTLLENPALLEELEGYLVEAQKKSGKGAKLLYSLIGSMHSGVAVSNKEFFDKLHEKYPAFYPLLLKHEELVNKDDEIIQQYFFYDDSDGHSSYENFLRTYGLWDKKTSNGWTKTEFKKKGYILLRKTKNGVTILKYANMPGLDMEGIEAVQEALKKKDLSTIEIVHRGHSYHVGTTLDYLPSSARVVYLGSCGGFNNLTSVLRVAPNSHIIATKGEGTKVVNDALLKMLDETMLKGNGVKWNKLWGEAEERFRDKRFQDYVNPADNIAVGFIGAVRKYEGTDQ